MCKGAFDVKTKLLSWLLTLSLLMTMLPTAALAAAAPGTSSGTVIYVSETGDDSAVGDENAPLKTIGAAFTKAADGDTICLLSDIKLVGNLVLTGDKSVTLAGKADETAKKITYQKDTSTDLYMIEVGVENGTATATNLTLENMTIDAEAQDIRCIRVCPESQLTLENGATVCNGRAVHRSGHSGNTGTNDWGGGIVVDSTAKLIMNDGSAVTDCFAEQGGGIYLSGEMELNGGMLSGNTAVGDYFDTDHTQSAHGGAILIRANRADYDESYDAPAKLTMTGGNIQNNKAASDLSAFGGAVAILGTPKNTVDLTNEFIMTGGTISGNSTAVDSATIQQPNAGGGGVFVEDNASFEMTNGTITGNKTNGMGGGVATAVLSENDTVGGGWFHMTDGTISDNTASCGGGVYSWSGRNRVVLEGGNIVNNTAYRQGGGVYVSHAPWSITIKNALITANKAAIQGGGIWSCPVGTVSLGTDAAVFGNTAGKSADDAAFLLKWDKTFSTSFSGKMYGGGLVTWYRDTSIAAGDPNYGAFGGDRYDAANPGAPVKPASGATNGYGLKAVVSAESKALAETAPLKIMGNTAERGGGVGTNGEVIIPGEDTLENPVSLTVHKVWSGASAYPTAVTVNLIRIAKDGTRTAIGTVLLSERSTDKDGKTWSYTFANLDGAYTYTVEEEAVDGFNTSISGSMADGFTITNSKRSGGGGGGGGHHKPDPKPTPDPDPKPPVDIPDQPTPLDPLKPTENIPDGKVPTTKPETQTKTPDKTKTVNIPDSKTPTSSVPKTGDIGGLWAALCGLSAMGLAYFGIRRKHD